MEHLLEVIKIVEGGLQQDTAKVSAYAQQLAQRLSDRGDAKSADRLASVLKRSNPQLSAARFQKSLPVDSESRFALLDEEAPGCGEVVLPEQVRPTVAEFTSYVRNADKLIREGVGISPSMLIYGPPGTGKTQLARHIASELDLPLLLARSDSLISSYLGSTSKNLRVLFEHARSRPCVLFLDEFDAIAKVRDDRQELGELKRVVVSLLQNLDSTGDQVITIAATNHQHLLDPAIWRRFSYHIQMPIPGRDDRARLVKLFLGKYSSDDIASEVAVVSEGLSGADLKNLCLESVRRMIIDQSKTIDRQRLLVRVTARAIGVDDGDRAVFIQRARNHNVAFFTYRRLGEMLGVSHVTARRLAEKEVEVNA